MFLKQSEIFGEQGCVDVVSWDEFQSETMPATASNWDVSSEKSMDEKGDYYDHS